MAKFAVIETGGKQYRVSQSQKLNIEKIAGNAGDAVTFDKVLLTADGDTAIVGTPYVGGAKVSGKIVEQGRADKVIVFRYHSKTRYRKKKGHRQHYTKVEIENV